MNNAPEFKGGADSVLRYLATNQAVGANCVDLGFMVIPRTTSDFVRRGPDAGLETGRRESMGTINDSLMGVYGAVAGAITAAVMGMKSKFGAKINKVLASPETANILAENKAEQIKTNKTQAEYLEGVLSRLKAYNPSAAGADKEGYVKLSEKTIKEVAEILDSAIGEMPKDDAKSFWEGLFKKEGFKPYLDAAINMVTEQTGAQSKYILESADGKLQSVTNLPTVLEDICRVSNVFNKEKVSNAFVEQVRNNKGVVDNTFMKAWSKFAKSKSAAGFAVAAAVGLSVQPINMYLTKKKTGSDGFVGVEGRTKDTSKGFFALKVASGLAFFAVVLKSIGTGLRGFMDKMAFKGFWPTINQLKGVYGLTIISRALSARDKDELRESLTKDILGFFSWLVLGDIVNRMTAESLDKSVMNRTKDVEKESWFKRVFHSSLKTRDEILIETLAKNGVSTTKTVDGKKVAKTFSEMMKDLDGLANDAIKNATKKRLKTLNRAQMAGYLFSGLVLGLGIPNLNIYITNKLDKKKKAKAEAAKQAEQTEQV